MNNELFDRSRVPLAVPEFSEAELQRVARVLQSGWVAQGPEVALFEQQIADYVSSRHAVAVSSCTAALHLALIVARVRPGDEVILPSMTFIATANAVRYAGATPVFVDVQPSTFNIDTRAAANAITPRTRAIIAVDQFGMPADLDALMELAAAADCALIEDAACALGSRYRGQPVGSHGHLTCFSFHPRKVITTGEGGMIVVDDADAADRLKRLRHHGMSISDLDRHRAGEPVRERYDELGYNYRMSDLQAAVGIAQLARLEEFVRARRRLVREYDDAVDRHPFLRRASVPTDVFWNGQSYAVLIADDAPLTRDELIGEMFKRGVAAKHGLACVHREPCYRATHASVRLPNSESLARRMALLPIYPSLDERDRNRVIHALFDAFGLACPVDRPVASAGSSRDPVSTIGADA